MTTQLIEAKNGNLTLEMEYIAQKEGICKNKVLKNNFTFLQFDL